MTKNPKKYKAIKKKSEVFDYYLVYKPYGVLCQFSSKDEETKTLADLHDFPDDVYPVGRLDKDSEGLIILTNDTSLNKRLLDPKEGHQKTYWAQVEGIPTREEMQVLRKGVKIKHNKKSYKTKKCKARKLQAIPILPRREKPIRFRKEIPTSWIQIILTEGKNRQVRKMTAQIGHPTLRLCRVKIGDLIMRGMESGKVVPVSRKKLFKLLFPKSK